MKRSRFRRWLRRVLLAGLCALPVLFVLAWLSLHYVPAWYQPAGVADDELPQVRKGLTDTFGSVSDLMVAGAPFTVTLTDRQVSQWLTARADIWPDSETWVPPWLRGPVVAFVPGRVVLAACFDRSGWESIVGLHHSIEVRGGRLTLKLESVTVGAVPVPVSLLAGGLNSLLRSDRFDVDAMPDELAQIVRKLRQTDHLETLTNGLTLDETQIWRNGDRPYRIRNVEITQGQLELTIEPL